MYFDGDWQAVEGVLTKDVATVGEYLLRLESLSPALQKQFRKSSTSTIRKVNVSWGSTYTTKLWLSAQMPRSNVGQIAHVSPTSWVTSQEADITLRAPEAACWLQLGCWSNNSANSHPSPGALNRRVLCLVLVPQCLHPTFRPRHQRRLANCDWILASYTSGQPSNPRSHPTC